MPINTTRDALVVMAAETSRLLHQLVVDGYTDSDYDVLENCLDITQQLLAADYESQFDYLPMAKDAVWCPPEVIDFLRWATGL